MSSIRSKSGGTIVKSQEEDEIEHTSAELLEMLHKSFRKSDDLLTKIRNELH